MGRGSAPVAPRHTCLRRAERGLPDRSCQYPAASLFQSVALAHWRYADRLRDPKDVDTFVTLLLEPSFTVLLALIESLDISDEDKAADEVADVLVVFLRGMDRIVPFLKLLIGREAATVDNPNTLFRRNSIASKMLTRFTSDVGQAYLHAILADVVRKAGTMAGSECELNPDKGGTPASVGAAAATLTALCTTVMHNSSANLTHICPPELRDLCHHLKHEVAQRFGEKMGLSAVGGYVFLRFVCPAMLAPERYGLAENPAALTKDARRVLMGVSKVIQTLANGVTSFKEDYMRPMDQFLESNSGSFAAFLDRISRVQAGPSPAPPPRADVPPVPVERAIGPVPLERPDVSPRVTPRPPPRSNALNHSTSHVRGPAAASATLSSQLPATGVMPNGLLVIQHHLKRNIHKIGSVIAALDSTDGLVSLKSTAEKAGWLWKRGGRNKAWKKRWFVIKGAQMVYFVTPQAGIAGGRIPLTGTRVEAITATEFTIVAEYRSYEIQTESEPELKDWVRAVQQAQRKGNDERAAAASRTGGAGGGPQASASQNVSLANSHNHAAMLLGNSGTNSLTSSHGGADDDDDIDDGPLSPRGGASNAAALHEEERDVRGWLRKAGPKGTGWKRRWFILSGNLLIYFKFESCLLFVCGLFFSRLTRWGFA